MEQKKDFLQKYRDQRRDHARQAKDAVFDVLLCKDISKIVAMYSGAGDSGDVESITYFGPDAKPAPVQDLVLDNLVRELVEAVVPDGYENNEGGDGTVTVNVTERKVFVEHSQNVIDHEYDSYEV